MTGITGTGGSPLLQTLLQGTERTSAATTANGSARSAAAKSSSNDSAALSSVAGALAAGATDGDVRSEKVDAVRAALADGSYQVPASAVADKLIDHLLR